MPESDISRLSGTDWIYNALILAVAAGIAALLFHPGIRRSRTWRATVTPLASIVGSGMLVVAPLLGLTVGIWAVLAMGAIILLSYLVGAAVRYNIVHVEGFTGTDAEEGGIGRVLAWLGEAAKLALAGAYVIAVAFYLELLGAFVLRLFEVHDTVWQKLIASGLVVFIGIWGWRRGLRPLEGLETYAVNAALAIIGAMIAGLALYNADLVSAGAWERPAIDPALNLDTLRVVLGAFLVVQGFETSRYLRGVYAPRVRVRTMKYAQLIAGVLVVMFLGLATVLFDSFSSMDETAVIELAAEIALVLPPLLVVAAMMSQFSSAVADTIGSGGLAYEASHGRIPRRPAYLAAAALALVLLWSADIFAIIAHASRAFAVYYAIQCLMAAIHAFSGKSGRRWASGAGFAGLALAMLAITVFAIPAETASGGG